MADRSIVAKLRADISDLKGKFQQAKAEIASTAAAAEKANQAQVKSSARVVEAEKLRASVRKAVADQEIRSNELSRISAEKYGKTTSLIRQHEQALTSLGTGLTKVGLAAGVGFGVAVKSAAEFDQGMSNVAATGDDARANLGALRAEALELGAATKFSATESAEGIENLLKAGVSAQDTLGGGLKGALDLAAAGQISVAEASETAATALTQFKLSGADVPHVADLLAAGAGKAQGEVSDMSAALKQSGLVASQFGLSIEDTTGTLAAFASAGLIGSDAGTSFKTMLLALANPSKQSREKMDELGISAYDAQGKFVGVTNLAEQLKQTLSGLTEQQRNAALAQIFGNDAIRAANVLYTQGASGISDWVSKVNDQGYAAETAATKMDNLNGDLEQLKGALSTALIGGGSGSTEALRDITQAVTGLVNGFNDLDPATQSAAVKVLALVAVLGLGGGAVLKLVTSLAAGRAALVELGALQKSASWSGFIAGGSRAAAVTTGVAKAATALGVAYAAAAVGAQVLSDHTGPLVTGLEAAKNTLIGLSQSSDGLQQVDAFFRNAKGEGTVAAHGFAEEVGSLSGAFDRLFNASGYEQFTDKIDSMFSGLVGYTGDVDKLKASFSSIDQALAQLDPTQASEGFARISKTATDAGVPIQDLVTLFPAYKEKLAEQANQLGVTGLQAIDYAQWMQGIVPVSIAAAQAQKGLTASVRDAGPALEATRAALESLTRPLELTAEDAGNLAKSIFSEGDAVQNAVSTHSAYAAAIDEASGAMDRNGTFLNKAGTALSDNSEKGRENIAVLNNLATSGKSYVRSLVEQGASSEEAQKATQGVRDEFVKTAQQAGLSAKEAGKLADSYGLIPDEVSTSFDAFGLALQEQKVNDYLTALSSLPDDVKSKIEAIYNRDGAEAAIAELDRINGKTAQPRILTKSDAARVASEAQTVLGEIKDGRPNIRTGSNAKSASAAAQRFLDSIKDVDPRVLTKAELTAAREAKNFLNSIDRSVDVTITTTKIIKNVSQNLGYDISATGKRNAAGGPIFGPGTGTSDDVPIMASNGEYMQTAAAHSYYGTAGMDAIRARRVPKEAIAGYRYGGKIGEVRSALSFAGGGSINAEEILAIIRATTDPNAVIAAARKTLNTENAKIAKPKATLDSAVSRYNKNVDRRQKLREKVAKLKRAADATKGKTKADKEYKKALADLRDANNAVTRSTTDKKRAQEAYDKVADKSKAATEALKTAQDALAESSRQVSNTFRDAYSSKSTDIGDILELMKQGAGDLATFTAQIAQLRKLGLSESVVQQVVGMGQVNGSDVASQITAGGAGLVAQLNAANDNLQKAADNLGFLASSGIQRRAGGGPVYGPGTGTSDSVLLRASAGEFMQSKASVDKYGLRFHQDVNNLRYQPVTATTPYYTAPTTREVRAGDVNFFGPVGSDAREVALRIHGHRRDQMTMAGLTAAALT